jgi:hypothetical protein
VTFGILSTVGDWVGSAAEDDAEENCGNTEEMERMRVTAVTATRPETG